MNVAAHRFGKPTKPEAIRVESGYIALKEWEDELALCQSYSFFATPSFFSAWSAHFAPDARVLGVRVQSSEGRLLFPFVEICMSRRMRTRALVASPEGGYGVGGSLPGRLPDAVAAAMRRQVTGLTTESVYLVSDPLVDVDLGAFAAAGFEEATDEAFVVPLSRGYEQWWTDALDKRVRRQVRKSKESGVVTSRRDLDGLDDFYRLYEAALSDTADRRPLYSKEFLRDLLGATGSGTVRLYLTTRGDECIAGGILLCGRASALAWIGTVSRAHADLYGNENRHAHVIQQLCEEGFKSYNLGACLGLPHVARFKQKFGAQGRRYSKYQWRNSIIGMARRLSHRQRR